MGTGGRPDTGCNEHRVRPYSSRRRPHEGFPRKGAGVNAPQASGGGHPRYPLIESAISGPGLAFGRSALRAAARGDESGDRGPEYDADSRG